MTPPSAASWRAWTPMMAMGAACRICWRPWAEVPAIIGVDTSHGRQVHRTRTTHAGKNTKRSTKRVTEVVYLIYSIPPE